MAVSNKERFAAYYQRKKQGIEIPKCKCDRLLKGQLAQMRRICTSCYKNTPDGRHKTWLAMNKRRGRTVLEQELAQWEGWEKGAQAIAPDGSVGTVRAIASWVNGDITVDVQFKNLQDNFIVTSTNPLISH